MPAEKETKSEKFHRVAAARVDKIVDMIRLLGNCSNTNNYAYTPEEVEKLFDKLHTELDAAQEKYKVKEKPKKEKSNFTF